jgi:hypothetical protein
MTDPRTPEEIDAEGPLAPEQFNIEDADLPSEVRDGDVSESEEEQPEEPQPTSPGPDFEPTEEDA